jgi:acetyl-CoA synthetase
MASMDIDLPSGAAAGADGEGSMYPPPSRVQAGAHVDSFERYKALYERSVKDPNGFWADMARSHLTWFRDFTEV